MTGGAGFIGSHYVRTMLSDGYPGYEGVAVTVLDSLTYAGNLANLAPVSASPRLRFVQGDIADAALVGSVVPGHDAVINFAAETHVDRSISGAAPFVATNVAGVQVLLQGVPGRRGRAGRAGLHRRGIRQHRVGVVDGAGAAAAELAVLGRQGRRRPDGTRLRPHPRAGRADHPLL